MMERRRKPFDARAMESAINKIRGVYAAQVVINEDTIEEIHVIASPLRKPKQIVRDIESMLLVNFNVRVDYRRISLVQMQEERLFQAEGRPRLVAVRSIDGPSRRAEVELEKDGHLYVGAAHATVPDVLSIRLVSIATIEAMEQVLGDRVTYRIDDVQQIAIGQIPAIVVVVTVDFESSQETLLGICQIRHEAVDAAARATLNAVNRRLLILKQQPSA
jgi:hypothetical protein